MNPYEVGSIAERIALEYEICFTKPEHRHLIRNVSQYSLLGYDIEAIEVTNGRRSLKAIEVKAWSKEGHFIISANEVETLKRLGKNSWIYVVDITKKKVIKKINDPFGDKTNLSPIQYKYFY